VVERRPAAGERFRYAGRVVDDLRHEKPGSSELGRTLRRSPEHFAGEELELIYIAKRLAEAKELERLLSDGAIEYLVAADYYIGGVIFRRTRVGAFFYVRAADGSRARSLLERHGYRPLELEDPGDEV